MAISAPETGDQQKGLDPALLADTERCVRQAAENGPPMPEFFDRLNDCGVNAVIRFGRNGRVRQFVYLNGGTQIAPSKLGDEFTWSGLQKKLGVQFDRRIHQQSLEMRSVEPQAHPTGSETMADEKLVERISAKLDDLKDLENRMCEVFDRMREQQTRDAQADLARLRDSSVRDLSAEFAKLRDDELAALSAAISPLGESLAQLRSDVQTVLTQVEGERAALQKSVRDAGEVSRQLVGAAEKMSQTTAAAVSESTRSVRNVDGAVTRFRQESLWLALSAALIAALLASLITGLWVSQGVEQEVARASGEIIQHLDKQAAEDPLRNYFNRLMEKLSK